MILELTRDSGVRLVRTTRDVRDPSPSACEQIETLSVLQLGQLDEIVEAVLLDIAGSEAVPQCDPPAAAILTSSVRAITARWLTAMAGAPAFAVPPDIPWETYHHARTLWHSGGARASEFRARFHIAQNTAWQIWQSAAIASVADAEVLAEVIAVSSESMFEYVQCLSDKLVREMALEDSASMASESHRVANARMVLHGSLSEAKASQRLGYELSRRHTCVIVTPNNGSHLDSTSVLKQMHAAIPASTTFHVSAPDGSLWIWLSGEFTSNVTELTPVIKALGASASVGESMAGLAGFRRSFETACSVQGLMRTGPRNRIVASFDDVALVTLAAYHSAGAAQFIRSTLGELAGPGAQLSELRETLRVYLSEGENAPRAAERLHTHRNTVNYRVSRAQALMPRNFHEHRLDVAAALELADWIGICDDGEN